MSAKSILRWCAMPFAAVIGAFVAYTFIALWIRGNSYGFQIYNGVEVGSITQITLAIAAQAVFGAGFVYCGSIVAPSDQRTCAVVLATVITVFSVVSFIISLSLHGFGFMQLIHNIVTAAGAISTVKLFDDQKNLNFNE